MKKVIITTFALAMMGSSVAFADANKLSAFQGVDTTAVSAAELDQVSGEGILSSLLGGILTGNLLSGVLNGDLLNGILLTAGNLGLLEGVSIQSNTNVQTGALIGGITGIQTANVNVLVH